MIKLQKSGNTEINFITSDDMINLYEYGGNEVIVPLYILKRGVGPITIWWNTVMDAYWNTVMTPYWNTAMDSVV